MRGGGIGSLLQRPSRADTAGFTNMIDLRSDTVTKPTAEMRKAMAEAEVGDAVIDIDPTVDRLERMTAEILGKEAAAFMPSGSMTNQISLRVHCGRSSEFICEVDSHIYNYEQGAFAQLSGLVARTIAGDGGVLRVEQLRDVIRPENEHMVRTELGCIENTHNRWGGRIQPQQEVERICEWADANGLRKHLDGARLWNAAVATGLSEQALAEPFDSVSVCFSKGLGAPVGSALAGSSEFISEARRTRKLFGGGMRQVGIIAAGAIYAIENHRERLAEDHQAAGQLADVCDSCQPLTVRGDHVDTNIVVLEIDPAWGTAEQLARTLAEQDVHCFAISPQAIRFVTHLDVREQQITSACEIIRTTVGAPHEKIV
jgi:threonine aldolase